jgi:thiol-disulfide isomerase/thioredoxin
VDREARGSGRRALAASTVALLGVALLGVAMPVEATSGAKDTPDALTLGQVLAHAPAHDLAGRPVATTIAEARLTIVYAWATWCGQCLQTLPKLTALDERLGPHGLRIVGLNVDVAPRRQILPWLARHRVTWPQWHDGRGRHGPLARRLQLVGVPKLLVFDAEGHLIASDPTDAQLRTWLAAAFDDTGKTPMAVAGATPRRLLPN